jgi:hypothetical protein
MWATAQILCVALAVLLVFGLTYRGGPGQTVTITTATPFFAGWMEGNVLLINGTDTALILAVLSPTQALVRRSL